MLFIFWRSRHPRRHASGGMWFLAVILAAEFQWAPWALVWTFRVLLAAAVVVSVVTPVCRARRRARFSRLSPAAERVHEGS